LRVYTVEARPIVRNALRQIDAAAWQGLLAVMRALADDPRPAGIRPLNGRQPWLRVRSGDYRVIYAIDDRAGLITVAVVGHRRDVYRNLAL
jgi:mRNA interferase RelE/StbE